MKDPTKISAGTLALLATFAVLALLLTADLSPRQAMTFEDLPVDGKSVQIPCIAISSREAKGGFILELQDKDNSVMKAYCASENMVNMTFPCAVLVTGQMDDGEEPFMFIDEIAPQT